jgi:flotillin
MSSHLILAVVAVVLVYLVFAAFWASRYTKVAPNRVLIVSGRQHLLPDGRRVDFRLVKGGGTFVFPVIEKVDVLSLEVMTLNLLLANVSSANGQLPRLDCSAQVKIKGDDTAIVAAVEHFLSKTEAGIANILNPLLEKQVRNVLATLTSEEIRRNPTACADKVQSEAGAQIAKMGMEIISITILCLK